VQRHTADQPSTASRTLWSRWPLVPPVRGGAEEGRAGAGVAEDGVGTREGAEGEEGAALKDGWREEGRGVDWRKEGRGEELEEKERSRLARLLSRLLLTLGAGGCEPPACMRVKRQGGGELSTSACNATDTVEAVCSAARHE